MNTLSHSLLLALTGTALSTAAIAVPQVDGTTITWPNDGWYQVLDADDYSQLCNGGTSCEVGAGRYIVINHTTGQRFENVIVRGDSSDIDGIRVTGNTISWENDGWYQVQRSDDYSTLCNGGTSCEVEDGVYTVINHSIGKRYPGILVDGTGPVKPPSGPGVDTAGPDANGITVDGNTISWQDDGWYQVQNADNFESLCEGGTSCVVPAGLYFVINLTTGERFEGYVVEDATDNPGPEIDPNPAPVATLLPAPAGEPLQVAAPYLLESLAGYQLEQANVYVTQLAAEIESSSIGQTELETGSVQFSVRELEVEVPNARNEVSCLDGGTMVRETAVLDTNESDFSQSDTLDSYIFTDCRFSTSADGLVAGNYVLNGTMTSGDLSISGRRFTSGGSSLAYEGFSMLASNDTGLTIDGSVDIASSDSLDDFASRQVTIDEYEEIDDGVILRSIRDGDFSLNYVTEQLGGVQNFTATLNGRILGTVTQGMDISIGTIDPLERQTSFPSIDIEGIPFRGQVQLSSTDGSELTITANPEEGENQSFRFDYTLLTSDGDTLTGTALPFPALTAYAPLIPLF